MRRVLVAFSAAALLVVPAAKAQCFNRSICDPSILEVRTQMNINVPITSPDAGINATEEARKQLYALSNRECDVLHKVYGGDCVLSSVNMNSSMQDSGTGGHYVFVTVSNVYTIKRVRNTKQTPLQGGCCRGFSGYCSASHCDTSISGPTF